ncbi:TPA: hypothetical protein ACG3B1_000150 [Streptococcus agalactiae]
MSWSRNGSEVMSQTILLSHEGNLRDLFFGKWRAQYEAIKNEGLRKLGNHFKYTLKEYNLPSLRRNEKSPKAGRSFYD